MVRKYKRKSTRCQYDDKSLSGALQAISNGMPLKSVSKEFSIPARTLRRHRDKKVFLPGKIRLGRFYNALPDAVENELKSHIVSMERRLYGLRTCDVRRLAFDVAEQTKIDNPFNKHKRMAGKDWLQNFFIRHNLSLRQPQGTNISRLVGFNRAKVDNFFSLYVSLIESSHYSPSNVWNMDETGLTTVQKPGKVMAQKGVRQVGKATSGERGVLVTFVCAMNASGNYLPPMYIFPRVRMVDSLMNGSPPQAVGYANPSGWIDSDLFLKWLEHFVNVTKSSKENPNIILLDGHHSHKTLAAINYCRENGIELLTFPPHCTHKMQPLDRSYFKSLKAAFNASADAWMHANPGRRITIHEIAELSGKAFLKTATADKAVNGFRSCGIWPCDASIFTDEDFAGAHVTDEPDPEPNNGQSSRELANKETGPINQQSDIPLPIQGEFPYPPVQVEQPDPSHQDDQIIERVIHIQGLHVIPVVGDGSCLFRSLATCMIPMLQDAERGEDGTLLDNLLALVEKAQADELRSKVVGYMCENINDYKDVGIDIVNADLPNTVRYSSILHRITAMSEPHTMPGEIEIVAACNVLRNPISVYSTEHTVIAKFGENFSDQPLLLQFKHVGNDVGHYDCLLEIPVTVETDCGGSTDVDMGKRDSNEDIGALIQSLSPLPKLSNKRPRTRKAECAAVLTSSPYKQKLLNRTQGKSSKVKTGVRRGSKGKSKKTNSNESVPTEVVEEGEDWFCLVCCETYSTSRPGDVWVQCQVCLQWAHEACTPGLSNFICEHCDSNDD